jgi:hypothetical protein
VLFLAQRNTDTCDLLLGTYSDRVNYFLGKSKTEMRNSENKNIFYVRKIYIKMLESREKHQNPDVVN